MGRLIDYNDVYNAIQITTDNFGVAKNVVETNMLTMLSKMPTVEAIPKDQYEQRLKADMAAMLTMFRQDLLDKLAEEKSPYHISDVGIGLEIAIKIIEEYEEKLK